MLTLYLLRHAKSSWKDKNQSDFDRPLNQRGHGDAVELGCYLHRLGIHPDLVLLSKAKRTCETFEHMVAQMSPPSDVMTLKKLYSASPTEIITEIKNHGNSSPHLMVIAHNPGIEALAWQLTASDPNNALAILAVKYPSAGLATLTFDISTWDALTDKSGTLVNFTTPRLRLSSA